MITINNIINEVRMMKQPKWMIPGLIALALVTAVLGTAGCSPPHH